MHIYAFGSLCRGEIDEGSDIDMLAIVDDYDSRFDPAEFSIYSYNRVVQLWREGNPFAWHLHLESRLIYASDRMDFLVSLSKPSPYQHCVPDCEKFHGVFEDARMALASGTNSFTFELSTIFLAVRNLATCYLLGVEEVADFSRQSARRLSNDPVPISDRCFAALQRARVLATRGKGEQIAADDVVLVVDELTRIVDWMQRLVAGARAHERIQKSNGGTASSVERH